MMTGPIDSEQVRRILAEPYTYYSKDQCRYETLGEMTADTDDLLARWLTPSMRVLDVGCGDGRTLIRHAGRMGRGVGLDECQEEIEAARSNARRQGMGNLEFIKCFIRYKVKEGDSANALPFGAEEFDLVMCERGPLAYCDNPLSEAMRVLRPGGLVFVETLGERNLMEVRAVFEPGFRMPETCLASLDAERARFERHGVRLRMLASKLLTLRFPDFYQWLRYQCSVWTYLGRALPSADDMGLFERFVVLTADEVGRISITYHPIWLAGYKPAAKGGTR